MNLKNFFDYRGIDGFLEDYYEKKVCYFSHNDQNLQNLFTLNNIEDYLFKSRAWEVKEPWKDAGVIVVNASKKSYQVKPDSLEQILEFYSQGYTIVLPRAQIRHQKLQNFVSACSKHFKCRVDANIYITPPNAQGFKTHLDMHDVFILQVKGKKDWLIAKELNNTLTHNNEMYRKWLDDFNEEKDFINPTKFELVNGQKLYIPRGVYHCGKATETMSIHISITLFPMQWTSFLENQINIHYGKSLIKNKKDMQKSFLLAQKNTNTIKAHDLIQPYSNVVEVKNIFRTLNNLKLGNFEPTLHGAEFKIHNESRGTFLVVDGRYYLMDKEISKQLIDFTEGNPLSIQCLNLTRLKKYSQLFTFLVVNGIVRELC